jgi:hypothetical protein
MQSLKHYQLILDFHLIFQVCQMEEIKQSPTGNAYTNN